ncbi:MAG: ATP-binding protein [Dehalococcoidales bacterium]
MEIQKIILDLLSKGYEGGYWDFKQKWHDNKALLIHDILCFSNNLENKDSFIIIGVEDDGSVVGVDKNDSNRKNTAMINDLLSNLKMGGDYRPNVYVSPIDYENRIIDVIIIRNSANTPYYLTKNYSDNNKHVRANHIYTRINDKNTAIDSSADFDKQEYLWKKRFRINESIFERLMWLLDDLKNWGYYSNNKEDPWHQGVDFGNCKYAIHRHFPEFRIEKVEDDERETYECEGYCSYYLDGTAKFIPIKIFYHSTLIYETKLSLMDSTLYIPTPRVGSFSHPEGWGDSNKKAIYFYYYIANTVEGKLLSLLTNGKSNITSARGIGDGNWEIIFTDFNEEDRFIEFAEKHPEFYDKSIKGKNLASPKIKVLPAFDSKFIEQAKHFFQEFIMLGKK